MLCYKHGIATTTAWPSNAEYIDGLRDGAMQWLQDFADTAALGLPLHGENLGFGVWETSPTTTRVL